MKVLVFNCGSSSLKFKVIDPQAASGMRGRDYRLARGIIERIGDEATCTFEASGLAPYREAALISHHEEAVRKILHWLDSTPGAAVAKTLLHDVDVVGHRIVHGGDRFTTSVVLDDQAIAALEALNELAPLHNPPALKVIQACRAVLEPSVPMVAAFDTAFHRTLPEYAAVYALPYELSQRHGIRRYGFHGLAHRYVAWRFAELTAIPIDQVKIVTLHLGNGCSASAISGGIGEHSPPIRASICEGMQWCGLAVDPARNAAVVGVAGQISPPDAGVHVYVIPSDEELLIARDAANLLQQ